LIDQSEIPIEEKLLLTTRDLSVLLGVAVITIKISRKTGELLGQPAPHHIKIGRLVRYRRTDVLNWVNSLADQSAHLIKN
jgi:predicted DNA-binding transcriptional regulator AlpA